MNNNKQNKNRFYDELIKGQTKSFPVKKVKVKQSEWATIDPLQAKHILKYNNSNNRRPSRVQITKYAKDMMNGDWKETGEPISFDQSGNLINGQHRLAAMVETNTPIEFLINYGLNREVFDVIDNGLSRTNSTILEMDGYKNSANLSALVRSIIAYNDNGNYDAKNFKGVNQITISQIKNFLEDESDTIDYLDRYKKSSVVSASVSSFCYWLLAKVDAVKAEEMLDKVFLGYGLVPNTIEHYLFDKLQRNKNANTTKLTKTAVICHVILCWRRVMGWSRSKAMQLNWDSRSPLPKPIR